MSWQAKNLSTAMAPPMCRRAKSPISPNPGIAAPNQLRINTLRLPPMHGRKCSPIRSSEDFGRNSMTSNEPPSLLLLASKLGYQTRSFAEAARRLGVGVIIGSDRCHQLEDPWADEAIPLHFEEPRDAAARLAAAVHPKNIGAILALGDRQTATAAYAARLLNLPYNSPESVENCRSKLRQREVLQKAG